MHLSGTCVCSGPVPALLTCLDTSAADEVSLAGDCKPVKKRCEWANSTTVNENAIASPAIYLIGIVKEPRYRGTAT